MGSSEIRAELRGKRQELKNLGDALDVLSKDINALEECYTLQNNKFKAFVEYFSYRQSQVALAEQHQRFLLNIGYVGNMDARVNGVALLNKLEAMEDALIAIKQLWEQKLEEKQNGATAYTHLEGTITALEASLARAKAREEAAAAALAAVSKV